MTQDQKSSDVLPALPEPEVWCAIRDRRADFTAGQMRDFAREAVALALAAQKAAPAGWNPIETAPKDGTEFVVRYTLQGNVKRLVRWSTLYGHWESKGEAVIALELQKVEWAPLPNDSDKGPVVAPSTTNADEANSRHGEAYGVDWVYAAPSTPPSKAEQAEAPSDWREHVEQRIRTWKQRTMNKSGDRLSIEDFMGQDSIDDLVDFVCDEWTPLPPASKAEPVVPVVQEWVGCGDCDVVFPCHDGKVGCFRNLPQQPEASVAGEVLTDEQIFELADSDEANPDDRGWGPKFSALKFARLVERAALASKPPQTGETNEQAAAGSMGSVFGQCDVRGVAGHESSVRAGTVPAPVVAVSVSKPPTGEQKPVAEVIVSNGLHGVHWHAELKDFVHGTKLYTAPQPEQVAQDKKGGV